MKIVNNNSYNHNNKCVLKNKNNLILKEKQLLKEEDNLKQIKYLIDKLKYHKFGIQLNKLNLNKFFII